MNVTALTLQTDSYFELLKNVSLSGNPNKTLNCLEITEQTAMQINSYTINRLQEIKNLGYLLAIDDFSMGHTSLSYLKENHFDEVKLDGSLVSEMTNNPRSYDIIKTITALAGNLGFTVVAEYVETDAQVKMLKEANCTHYQGYLFSKAITRDEWIENLRLEKSGIYPIRKSK